jgi:hypothetical protein
MSLELVDLKRMHDKAYNKGQVTRQRAADDMVFYFVTMWDDLMLDESQLAYRGEFDILRKAGRQILSTLAANPVSIDFDPKAESRQDGADLINGLYRSDDRRNGSIEAFDNGSMESVVCGIGGWELVTEYESLRAGNDKQVIRRKPIYEFNNTVFFDPNAKLLDKSDAMWCSKLHAYSEDGYKALVKELTGDEDVDMSSFAQPDESYAFPWFTQQKMVHVVEFYHKEKVKDVVLVLMDPLQTPLMVREADMDDGLMDELIDLGYTVEETRKIDRYKVTKYIASGQQILAEDEIAGENIPIVPVYGERAFVEDEEHYEGVTRLAKDPQRLRNFQMSYLADIVSRSPRPKPIFLPEQIEGHQDMYSPNGADNNYPYLLQNRLDANGGDLPIGPVAQMPEQKVPDALIQSLALSREAVQDVADPGLPQNISDPDLSGKAVYALQNRMDQQTMIYQTNLKHAKRHDAVIYAGMASEVYSSPRQVTVTSPDGQRETKQVMQTVVDETGTIRVINDLTNTEFDVYADVGPSYSTQKEQTREELATLMGSIPEGDPMRDALMLKFIHLIDGVQFDDVRAYANKRLLLSGIKEPETEEEMQVLQQAQQAAAEQGQQPSPEMILAQGELLKGQAAMAKEQREAIQMQIDHGIDVSKLQISMFEAQTGRMGVQVKAAEAGANIETKRIEALGRQLDRTIKLSDYRGKAREPGGEAGEM